MKTLHPVAGMLALATILAFWLSTAVAETIGTIEVVRAVKLAIPWGLLVLVPALALTGVSGFRIGGRWKSPIVAAKMRRMPFIALNGILVLVPCALVLRHFALAGDFGTVFYLVQALELAAGAVNICLMALNVRDGMRLGRRLRA